MRSSKIFSKLSTLAPEAIASRIQLEMWLKTHIADADLNQEKYTNGVLVATILHNMYPCVIDPSELKPPTCLVQKIKMWKFFNEVFLINLGIRLQEWEIIRIARGTHNCIDRLLYKLMKVDNMKLPYLATYPLATLPKYLRNSSCGNKIILNKMETNDISPMEESVEPIDFNAVSESVSMEDVEEGESDPEMEELVKRVQELSFEDD